MECISIPETHTLIEPSHILGGQHGQESEEGEEDREKGSEEEDREEEEEVSYRLKELPTLWCRHRHKVFPGVQRQQNSQ